MPDPNRPVVCAFDFDGTVTYRDTLVSFLLFTAGYFGCLWRFVLLLPAFTSFALGALSRQEIKEKVLSMFFRGKTIQELERQGRLFAAKRIPSLIKPEALRRIQWHKKQGHRLVLVSASLDVYLLPWANMGLFSDVVSSSLQVDGAGKVSGKLKGLNCWGLEKKNRLDALLGPREKYFLIAYGDSRGDRELLAYADQAYFRKMPVLEKKMV